MTERGRFQWRAATVVAIPYAWVLLLLVAPLALVFKLSLSQSVLAQPPYAPVFDWADNWGAIGDKALTFTLDAYRGLFSDSLYVDVGTISDT